MENLLKDLIAEAIEGKIKIKERGYNIGFNTNIVNGNQVHSFKGEDKEALLFPTLQINNLDVFTSYLCEYVEQAKSFYKDEIDTTYGDYSETQVSKLLMSLIWSNATTTDFNNPIEYLKRRINFLKDRRMDDYFEKRATDRIMMFDDSLLSYNVRKSPLILEAPYVLEARLESDDFMEDSYQLPSIFFGLDNDTCHIYAIQNKGKVGTDLSKYQKSIKRKMNKVKKGFSEDIHLDEMPGDDVETFNINYPENITSVDPSFLVSLTVNLALLNNVGISNIVVPDFYPVRFNSQQIITNIRANYQLEDEKEHFLIKEELQSDRINRNIVDKKIRTFRRLAHHFDFLNVDVFPKEVDDFLHVSISDNYCCNNEVLDQVYTKVDSSINENKHRRI